MKRGIAVGMIIIAFLTIIIGGGMEVNGGRGDDGLIEWNCLPVEEEVLSKEDDGLIEWNDFTIEEYA